MAVYTTLTHQTIASHLANFDIGTLTEFKGAPDGIENTTYFITTDQGEYVLTLSEWLESEQLPFFIDLTTLLNQNNLPVPCPLIDKQSKALMNIADKPALLFPRIKGLHTKTVNVAQCQSIGEFLGQMHAVTRHDKNYNELKPNTKSFQWCCEWASQAATSLDAPATELLNQTIEQLTPLFADKTALPRGIIHADLFTDNVLMVEDEVTAVIDFYLASSDFLLLDLAITVNAWCSAPDGRLIDAHYRALLDGYQRYRSFEEGEKAAWPQMMQAGALRFWLSRILYLQLFPNLKGKAPQVYQQILQHRLEFYTEKGLTQNG
ncbi:MAG: homoserine kinase [Algicola sp.]|nr:homoserine kinase [Algicola sp.]